MEVGGWWGIGYGGGLSRHSLRIDPERSQTGNQSETNYEVECWQWIVVDLVESDCLRGGVGVSPTEPIIFY